MDKYVCHNNKEYAANVRCGNGKRKLMSGTGTVLSAGIVRRPA